MEAHDDDFILLLQAWPYAIPCLFLQSYSESGGSHQDFSLRPTAFAAWSLAMTKKKRCIVSMDVSAPASNPSLGR